MTRPRARGRGRAPARCGPLSRGGRGGVCPERRGLAHVRAHGAAPGTGGDGARGGRGALDRHASCHRGGHGRGQVRGLSGAGGALRPAQPRERGGGHQDQRPHRPAGLTRASGAGRRTARWAHVHEPQGLRPLSVPAPPGPRGDRGAAARGGAARRALGQRGRPATCSPRLRSPMPTPASLPRGDLDALGIRWRYVPRDMLTRSRRASACAGAARTFPEPACCMALAVVRAARTWW